MATDNASLAYHEPDVVTILIYSSFLFLLNTVNYALDKLVYCGLIGQIFLGVAWGAPGAKWLPLDAQNTIVSLGYIGLILLVFEGGLSTDLKTLKANLSLSALVAIVGITAPIGLSFILRVLLDITPVQAFAAGAALCSTSLGTTFTVLSTSGLTESRLGVVLTSAAMLDDVVGLVMVQVISSLGSPAFSATTVIRPVGVSIAFAVGLPLLCLLVVKPLARRILGPEASSLPGFIHTPQAAFIMQTLVLLTFIAASSYAGTSNLFAAYLAGASITWFDDLEEAPINETSSAPSIGESTNSPKAVADSSTDPADGQLSATAATGSAPKQTEATSPDRLIHSQARKQESDYTGARIFHSYYQPALSAIFKPLFFASIGFSIPITRMFGGQVVWRGIVYALLMVFGKLLCGACLVRFSVPSLGIMSTWRRVSTALNSLVSKKTAAAGTISRPGEARETRDKLPKPLSLYPAAFLGSAMVSRGEIGFLISAVAESNDIFTSASGGDELFLIVTWAILLCTVIGPITIGLLVKRVRTLQATERERKTGKEDPLGIWGIVPHN